MKAILAISSVLAHMLIAVLIGAGVVAVVMPNHPAFIALWQQVCGVQ